MVQLILSNCYLGRTSLPPSCKKRLGATVRRSHISIKYPQKGKVLPITLLEIPSRLPNGGASTSLWRQTMAQKSYWCSGWVTEPHILVLKDFWNKNAPDR